MNGEPLPSLVLGHNQFFGIDHLSSRRGAERAIKFSNSDSILSLIHESYEAGARGLMLSTHQRSAAIGDLLRADRLLRENLQLFPLLPYAQKYVTRANEIGMVRAVTSTFLDTPIRDRLGLGLDFVRTVMGRDPINLVRALIRLELKIFKNLNTPVVFLHDAVSDLLLSLGIPEVFQEFQLTVKKHFNARPGIATKNLGLLRQKFSDWGLEFPVVLTHVNSVGYHVNPSIVDHERELRTGSLDVMAMGTLASGYLQPREAARYVRKFPCVKSVVVGVSSRTHIDQTFPAFLSAE